MAQLKIKQSAPREPKHQPAEIRQFSVPKPRKSIEPKEKKPRAKHQMLKVYGSSDKATKTRRCGECEGCMRDDCGKCAACADKPRFGGRGSKKKACLTRSCRMRGPPPEGKPDDAVNVKDVCGTIA